jgi:hypothetical protein
LTPQKRSEGELSKVFSFCATDASARSDLENTHSDHITTSRVTHAFSKMSTVNNKANAPALESPPEELCMAVVEILDMQSIIALSQTNRQFHRLADPYDELVWQGTTLQRVCHHCRLLKGGRSCILCNICTDYDPNGFLVASCEQRGHPCTMTQHGYEAPRRDLREMERWMQWLRRHVTRWLQLQYFANTRLPGQRVKTSYFASR